MRRIPEPAIRRTAALNGTKLYYEVHGSGPVVVLVSGGGTLDRRMWDGQIEAFARRHTVVRYDIRGIGESARPDGPFSHSEDLRCLMQALGGGAAHVVGLSFGAAIAIDLALEHPELVNALVLAAPGLSSDKAENLRGALEVAGLAQRNGLASVIDAMVSAPAFLSLGTPRVRQHLRTIYLDNADVFATNFPLLRLWQPTEPPAEQRLTSIRAPTLILVGDRDSPTTRRTADALLAAIQGSRMTVVPGAGHLLNLDAPKAFNRAALDFVAESDRPEIFS
jgi:pimeloyl-ACP methyl ester carboxylesterase